jgi:glycosyltransferase involved in cell wall biosynthesis
VVQKFSSGVGSAIAHYTHSVPELAHHLLTGTAVDAEGDLAEQARFASVHRMEGGVRAKISRVREVVRELRPDVVHAHSSHGGAFARLAIRRTATHLVYTPHCYAFERRDVGVAVRAAFWAAEALLAVNTSGFAACSTREWQLSAWPTRRAPRYVVPNIAPPAARAPGPRRTGTLLVAGGGRLSPQKDPEFFLASVRRLREARPGLRAVWLGDGDPVYRRPLEDGGIQVTGWLPQGPVLELLGRADLYLHSARWEGFPLMVAEAVALGVPTLVRRVPTFDDVPAALSLAGTDLDAALACLDDPQAAAANLAGWAGVLAHNTPADQRAALLDVYFRRPGHRLPPATDA